MIDELPLLGLLGAFAEGTTVVRGAGELRHKESDRIETVTAADSFGAVTNVAPVHLQFFGSLTEIASAKRELIENLAPPSTAILNFDDSRVQAFREGFVRGYADGYQRYGGYNRGRNSSWFPW